MKAPGDRGLFRYPSGGRSVTAFSATVSPWRISIGTLASANKNVSGSAPHNLKPTQKSQFVDSQPISLSSAIATKNTAQLRVSLRQPTAFSPGWADPQTERAPGGAGGGQ